jgi:hypothetical protein
METIAMVLIALGAVLLPVGIFGFRKRNQSAQEG